MKLIWKLKRFLLRIESNLICKRYKEGIIGDDEYDKRMSIINSRWWDICNQGDKNGW